MFFVIFFLFVTVLESHGDAATIAVSSLSMASSLNDLTSKKKGIISKFFSSDDEFCLEQVMLITKSEMNENGATKIHIVIVYDKELLRELAKMSANRYFQSVEQLQKDFPDKFKVIGAELVAKDRIIPWKSIDYPHEHMSPVGGLIFASYSNSGEHRAIIPNYVKLKIIFEQKDFRIEYEDKDNDEDDDES